MIILLLIQYLSHRPLSRKNMQFNIYYIVSVPPFCIIGLYHEKHALQYQLHNLCYGFDIEVHVTKNMHFNVNYIVSVPPFCIKWWNRDYVVDIEVHVFLDKGLWPKN